MKNRIVIHMEGGVIQQILADRPDDIEITLLDSDIEGLEEDDISYLFSGEEVYIAKMLIEEGKKNFMDEVCK